MLVIAVISIGSAYAVKAGAALSRHDAEQELLAVGIEFQNALRSFAATSPPGAPRAPRTLDDLLRDPRHPATIRHLRRLPHDPLTGKRDWMVVRSPQGIVAIHSAAAGTPLKSASFDRDLGHLEGERKSYRDWLFIGPEAQRPQ
ncbi:type II secretion system protein [Aquabacterium humicola]|uniref:type II secretion system protein n=1 Tax=Aquabacterium humicola TaxID=3237377 RepID=UPI0025433054|nr:type II secretion system protein [Rubrivivax pictus]